MELVRDIEGNKTCCCVSGSVTFVEIEHELTSLYEFYCLLKESCARKTIELENTREFLISHPQKEAVFQMGALAANPEDLVEIIDHISMDVWRTISERLVCFSILTQILSLIEFSLKKICVDFNIRIVKNAGASGSSKISTYLASIQQHSGLNRFLFSSPIDKARETRNKIAHGDWDEAMLETSSISIDEIFTEFCRIILEVESIVIPRKTT